MLGPQQPGRAVHLVLPCPLCGCRVWQLAGVGATEPCPTSQEQALATSPPQCTGATGGGVWLWGPLSSSTSNKV